jgi:hypothetical protein
MRLNKYWKAKEEAVNRARCKFQRDHRNQCTQGTSHREGTTTTPRVRERSLEKGIGIKR